jgi:A/G-specific adenine glycosylase
VSRTQTWFHSHQRDLPWRSTYDPYWVWVSEVMLQQTRMEVVLRYYERFLERFPTIERLAAASADDVTAAWSGLGYYRRARMLREGAQAVRQQFGGRLPRDLVGLQSIAGVGRYTAGAIASIAFEQHAPIVDGNIARILARLFGLEDPLGSPGLMRNAWILAERLVEASSSPRDFNQGLMEIGALICRPSRPDCAHCPLRTDCVAFKTGRTGALPVSKAKAKTRELRVTLYVATDRRGRILMRRERGPLMGQLFHLPHGDQSLLTGPPLLIERAKSVGTFRHTITNRRVTFEVFAALLPRKPAGNEYVWIDPASLGEVPHSGYVPKALRLGGIALRRRALARS